MRQWSKWSLFGAQFGEEFGEVLVSRVLIRKMRKFWYTELRNV